MLEEEMIDLVTFCLQNPDSSEVQSKKQRFIEIGRELFADGGIDAMQWRIFSLPYKIELLRKSEKTPNLLENCGRAFLRNGNNYRYSLEK